MYTPKEVLVLLLGLRLHSDDTKDLNRDYTYEPVYIIVYYT